MKKIKINDYCEYPFELNNNKVQSLGMNPKISEQR